MENLEQRLHIFRRGNAAQKNNFALIAQAGR